SPWHDRRGGVAGKNSPGRRSVNDAAGLGDCPPPRGLLPRGFGVSFAGGPAPLCPAQGKHLLGGTGGPNGPDAGDLVPIPPAFIVGEAVVNNLNAVGIRVKMVPMERAPFYAAWREKKLRGLFVTGAGASGNAATRVEAFIYSKGAYAYG